MGEAEPQGHEAVHPARNTQGGVGIHLLADLHGVAPSRLMDAGALMQMFAAALEANRFTVLDKVAHKFAGSGAGVTGVFLLGESHLAFHTYPELGFLALDIFSCGAADPAAVMAEVSASLQPQSVTTTRKKRGAGA